MQPKDVKDPWKEGLEVLKNIVTPKSSWKSFGTGGTNATYGWGRSADDYWKYDYACHAHMKNYDPRSENTFFFSKTVPPDSSFSADKAFKNYFDWLLGDDSPYTELFKLQPEILSQKKLCLRYGFVFTKIDTIPSNLLMNFLVATRMPKEWPLRIKAWDTLVTEHGCHPSLAFLFLSLFTPIGSSSLWEQYELKPGHETFRLSWTNFYDWPVDMTTCSMDYPENFIRGVVSNLNKPFTVSSTYTPVNAIWGKCDLRLHNKDTYSTFVFNTYNESFGKFETPRSSFGSRSKPSVTNWIVSYEDIISICKNEEARILKIRKATKECN